MVKKVQYKLIDRDILPPSLVCKSNAFDQLVGIDQSFTDEWLRITTDLTTIISSINREVPAAVKTNLYLSYMNDCGLLMVEDNPVCCSTRGCKC